MFGLVGSIDNLALVTAGCPVSAVQLAPALIDLNMPASVAAKIIDELDGSNTRSVTMLANKPESLVAQLPAASVVLKIELPERSACIGLVVGKSTDDVLPLT